MKILLVFNPKAKGCRQIEPSVLTEAMKRAGADVELVSTGRPDIAVAEARGKGYDRLAVAGGDGTLRSALVDCDCPVAIMPLGTTNSVARSLKLPFDPVGMSTLAATGMEQDIDMAMVRGPNIPDGEQYSILCTSAGLDAEIVDRYERTRIKHGPSLIRYSLLSLNTAIDYPFLPMRVFADGLPVEANSRYTLVSIMKIYAGWFSYSPDADPSDGLLDLAAMRYAGPMGHTEGVVRAYLSKPPRRSTIAKAKKIRIESSYDIKVQIDGEPCGKLPIEIESLPARAKIILPV